MLKIQELRIGEEVYRVREPRLKDYLRARKAEGSEFAFQMLAGMLLDEKGQELGLEAVENLPLRVFDELAKTVTELTEMKPGPLEPKEGSSTD